MCFIVTGNELTKSELQHIMGMMNAYGERNCDECTEIKRKIAELIERYPRITHEMIGGHMTTKEIEIL
ncbi:hypothetical protein CCP3SC15_420006 [Gammaproteobacteria bacterium]